MVSKCCGQYLNMDFSNSRFFSFLRRNLTWLAIAWVFFLVGDRHLQYQHWDKEYEVINNDVISYYAYLPATFIEKDLTLSFLENRKGKQKGLYWPVNGPNNSKVIKTSMGLSFCYAPFFLTALAYEKIFNSEVITGFETSFRVGLLVSSLAFLLLGLIAMGTLLKKLYSDIVSSILILGIGLGTNLWYYSIEETAMAHVYDFALLSVYSLLIFNRKFENKNWVWHGLLIGLISLIRPTNVLVFLIFFLFIPNETSSIYSRLTKMLSLKNIMFFILGFVLVWSFQFVYWKFLTGSILFFPYTGERFFFLEPEIYNGLFGFRKGWFIYTPLMLLTIPGYLLLFQSKSPFRFGIIVFWLISVYIMLSWWAWWYGGGFGLRPMIDFYGLLAIPIAALLNWSMKNSKLILSFLLLFGLSCFWVNRVQTQKYRVQLIHYDGMNWESYKHSWEHDYYDPLILDLIERPNYKTAKIKREKS